MTLLIGKMAADQFQYTVTDAVGNTAPLVDVKVCGDKNTAATISEDLGQVGCVTGQLFDDFSVSGSLCGREFTGFKNPDARLSELRSNLDPSMIDMTYCLSLATGIIAPPHEYEFTISILDAASYSAAIAGAIRVPGPHGGFNPQNADNVAWLLNEPEALLANGYTQGNIQRAIWNLLDGGADSKLDGTLANNYFNARPHFSNFQEAWELTE